MRRRWQPGTPVKSKINSTDGQGKRERRNGNEILRKENVKAKKRHGKHEIVNWPRYERVLGHDLINLHIHFMR